MRSFKRVLDKYDIASEVRFERAAHQGAFLIVEGDTDIKRFSPFMDENDCSIINAFGRDKAIGATEILSEEGFEGVVACVDSDFDRMLGCVKVHENIIYSKNHDFDLDWFQLESLKRYCTEVANAEKLESSGGVQHLGDRIKLALLPISIVRLMNRTREIRFKVKHVDAGKCFASFSVDFDAYYDLLSDQDKPLDVKKDELLDMIQSHYKNEYDLDQITNGHDLYCALGVSLQDDIGERRSVHTWGSEVEMHLRLSFSDQKFLESDIYKALRVWEADNSPYLILATHLQSSP